MRRLGAFIWFGYRIPIAERARLLREAGFETALHWWDDSFIEAEGFSKEAQAEIIRAEGLQIENAHLSADRANALWEDTLSGQAALDSYLNDIDGLAAHGIPVAVMHATGGGFVPPNPAVGHGRFRALASRAERRGVRIAVENVRSVQVLTGILDGIDSPMLGFCYDSGHDHLWSPEPYALLQRYKRRLFAVHLHDNLGLRDDHLAPGEGGVRWDVVRSGIKASDYLGSLTLEADSVEIPARRTAREHLKLHYDGAAAMLLGGCAE